MPVVASDVVERPTGTVVVPYGNVNALFEEVEKILSGGQNKLDSIDHHKELETRVENYLNLIEGLVQRALKAKNKL